MKIKLSGLYWFCTQRKLDSFGWPVLLILKQREIFQIPSGGDENS